MKTKTTTIKAFLVGFKDNVGGFHIYTPAASGTGYPTYDKMTVFLTKKEAEEWLAGTEISRDNADDSLIIPVELDITV